MSQSRFLKYVLTEGILLTILGLLILLLPKISPISFGDILSYAAISYGGYKIINGYIIRNLFGYLFLNFVSGLSLVIVGIMLLFVSNFSIDFIMSMIVIFFITSSVSTSAFFHKTKNIFIYNKLLYLLSVMEFLFGLITIAMLSSYSFWLVGFLLGLDFLIAGTIYTNLYYSLKT